MILEFDNDPITPFLIELHNIGLAVNEMKSVGETTVPIDAYENVLDMLINMTHNYQYLNERYDTFSKKVGEALGKPYYK